MVGVLPSVQVHAATAAQSASSPNCKGKVVDELGQPIPGVAILAPDGTPLGTTDVSGLFNIKLPANVKVINLNFTGYKNFITDANGELGVIELVPDKPADDYYGDIDDLIFEESVLDDDEGGSQNVAALTGSNDNIFYNTASYNFGPMYYRFRGLENQYQTVYINGLRFNDLIRGSFSFSTLLGMTSRAFRNKTTAVGLEAANYGFGGMAGSVNYNTVTDLYAPGFNGSLAYTNSNYMLRAMATYSTGLNRQGWAFTVSAIGRYANEGIMEGTFYNSAGLFLSVEKKFNAENSLTLTAFGGPTQRATGRPTYQEAYDLAGTNLYNPDWGWQDGKKRSSRITETFDPTAILTWLYKKDNTTVNTSMAFRSVYYNRTALQYYKANDPNPTYYRYLPSYYKPTADPETAPEEYEYQERIYNQYYDLWKNDESMRQIKWDDLYRVNALNNEQNLSLSPAQQKGSSYILENRTNHQLSGLFSSYINTRINRYMSLQAGVGFNYSKSSNYKTIRDLMGGEFWLDIDPFSDRELAVAPNNLQNDLDNPNRRVVKGDRFGYDYDIHALRADAWIQNVIALPRWDINYGLEISYTQFQRDGHMRNGRAPLTSKGKSRMMRYDNAALKAGAIYKLDGRNQFAAHIQYGSKAPLADQVFIAPRVKNDVVAHAESERNFSADLAYIWNYRRFRGSVTGFYTQVDNAIERNGFYDEQFQTYANYVLTGVKRAYKGVEVGMAYKITPSITATFAGMYSRFQYKSNPQGTRTFENGLYPDSTQT
ncbi:MAG: hypothetical protein K2F79_08535, partial [Muribaculaceae bacterium]|nr:hypothetical protein [Muribaculaceae bacterium]